ncbi:MAG: CarD family transcriptional regulator [Ezakiella sp.]|nr:CarD family transcriptional regulator [Ezakiella sp.]MDD7471594.1 CarD family transcriptional regulator [Bacillota bacterium]MDY3923627.1 CarD family transcriptional regulator [Ezakiella sp.]
MFKIGDKVSYPMHGAGTIVDISYEDFLGEQVQYYTISIPVGGVRVKVPVDKAEELGLRDIIQNDVKADIIDTLGGKGSVMPSSWTQRNRMNINKLRTGEITEVAAVVRNLLLLSEERNLASGDRKMLNKAMNLLLSELIMSFDIDEDEAKDRIYSFVFHDSGQENGGNVE